MKQMSEVVRTPGAQTVSPHSRAAPRWTAWVPQVAVLWPVLYGGLRLWWALHGTPSFGKHHFDLIYFGGWSAVGLCVAAALTSLALRFMRWNWPLFSVAWVVSAAHFIASPLLLLDLVSALLPGLGMPFSPTGFFSRIACVIQGTLVAASTVAWRRHWRSECMFCGRSGVISRPPKPPRWAWWAAYGAVVGCLVRLAAQYLLAFGDLARHLNGTRLIIEALLFEAGFLLAGVVLPLSLVHRWGRSFPAWIPSLGTRTVPRWLLLGPAFVLSPLMTAYFSITLVKLATDTLRGLSSQTFESLRPAFFWVAVPGYLVWGIGLGIAAISYWQRTRPQCRVCGQ
jgi:hypothetical protein